MSAEKDVFTCALAEVSSNKCIKCFKCQQKTALQAVTKCIKCDAVYHPNCASVLKKKLKIKNSIEQQTNLSSPSGQHAST